MKKIYEHPTLNVVHLKPMTMIMASENVEVGDSVTSASGAEAKGGFAGWSWDDDEPLEDEI